MKSNLKILVLVIAMLCVISAYHRYVKDQNNLKPLEMNMKIDTLWMQWDPVSCRFTPKVDTNYQCLQTHQRFKIKNGNHQ